MLDLDLYDRLRVKNSEDIRSAAILLRDTVETLCGLRIAVCHNIASSRPMVDAEGAVLASTVFGFEAGAEAWWLHPNLALSSPLAAACRFAADPFWCNAHGIWTRGPEAAQIKIDLSDFAKRALTKSAIVAPIHLPYSQVGAASFLPLNADREDLSQEFEAFSDILSIYVRQFISSYVQITPDKNAVNARANLSRREVECLLWAARGKTNEEIATILQLARSTIRFHIRSASEKLDAVNRDQTLFKAAQLGYLGRNL